MFGTGLGRYLPTQWQLRIMRWLSPVVFRRTADPEQPQFTAHTEHSAPSEPPLPVLAGQTDIPSKRYPTDSLSIVATNDLRLHAQSDPGIADHIVISLATTPGRAMSPRIFDVLDSLVSQSRKARKIYLALPLACKRQFAVSWESERSLFVNAVSKKYGSRIEIIDCEDDGPATRLLGLLGHAAEHRCLGSSDMIVVVDDDIVYSSDLVRLHELCHDLYQCDVGRVDRHELVDSWIPLTFKKREAVFSDDDKRDVCGRLSFSIKYDKTTELPRFCSETVVRFPNSLLDDDAIFSAYLKKQRLYATSINCAPLNVFSPTGSDPAKGVTELHDAVDPAHSEAPVFQIPKYVAPRSLRNCSNLSFLNRGRNVHLAAHYLANDQMIITVTVFTPGLIGSDLEVEFRIAEDFFQLPIQVGSSKFTVAVRACRPLFDPLDDDAEIPVVQTNSNAVVSRNKFYSVCTILNNTPTHEYLFFNEAARRKYIEDCYTEIVLKSYASLNPRSYKADLFRWLFAYLNECIYFDVKMVLNTAVSAMYHLDRDGQVFVKDLLGDHIYSAFFINRRARSDVFKYAVILSLDRIIWNDYCDGPLSVTGPGILGLAGARDGMVELALFNTVDDDWQKSYIRDRSGAVIINCSYPGYYDEDNYLKKYHYSVLWHDKQVFQFPPPTFMRGVMREKADTLRGIDRVLWLNVDHAKARSNELEDFLETFARVPHTLVDGIDARKALPWSDGSDIDAHASDPEIARCLSHLKALSVAREMEGQHFLIVEDDISLRFFPFLGSQDVVERIVAAAPGDWEIILLAWSYASELNDEFTDWNRSFDDGFHIAGTTAYIVNRSALEKIGKLFEMRDGQFHVRKSAKRKVLGNGKWLVSDVFIYSNLTTYVYKNRLFARLRSGTDSDHVEWHSRTQNLAFNHIGDETILGERAEERNAATRAAYSSRR